MNPADPSSASARPAAAPAPVPRDSTDRGQRLAFLFRHSLAQGQMHPLYPLLQRYRGLLQPQEDEHA